MRLDPDTLLVVNVVNLLVLAMALPVVMGARLSLAATAARRSLIVQAGGWIALIVSGLWPGHWLDPALSTLAMAAFGASNWLLFRALEGWLGPRPLRRTLAALATVMPLGYAITFSSYPVRVGWANLMLAAQLLVLARATLRPAAAGGGARGPWRGVLFACLAVMTFLTAGRGVMGAWFTELYPHFTAPHPFNLAALLAANVTLVMANVAVLVAWRAEAEAQLRAQAREDALTGLLNRQGWTDAAASAVALARRHRMPLALLVIDLDHFKQINDRHGHAGGDAALRLFGTLLTRRQRSGDVVARMGGEEFAVLLPMSAATAARGFDHRLRAALAQEAPAQLGFALDYSAGLTVLQGEADTLEAMMLRADRALYRAKEHGRGRLEPDDPDAAARP